MFPARIDVCCLPRQVPLTCVVAGRNSFPVCLFVEFATFACKRLLGDLDHNVDVKLPVVHLYRQVAHVEVGKMAYLQRIL